MYYENKIIIAAVALGGSGLGARDENWRSFLFKCQRHILKQI